jgi:TrmH family RNA methyltransferase
MIVDGARETLCALRAGVKPIELFLCESLLTSAQINELQDLLAPSQLEPTSVTREVFEKLAFGSRQDGVVFVAAEPELRLEQLEVSDEALIAVLEAVEKPGNLGAVVRTADAAGVSAVLVADGGTDIYNHNAIRASMGAIFRVPICSATAAAVLNWLTLRQAAIYAARVDGATIYTQVDYRGLCAIVLGSESRGLTDVWRGESVTPIALPMLGIVDSLNVSATAAVLFYEALRQRRG